jgi:hypothetical protein
LPACRKNLEEVRGDFLPLAGLEVLSLPEVPATCIGVWGVGFGALPSVCCALLPAAWLVDGLPSTDPAARPP